MNARIRRSSQGQLGREKPGAAVDQKDQRQRKHLIERHFSAYNGDCDAILRGWERITAQHGSSQIGAETRVYVPQKMQLLAWSVVALFSHQATP